MRVIVLEGVGAGVKGGGILVLMLVVGIGVVGLVLVNLVVTKVL